MNFFKALRFPFVGKTHGFGPAYDAYRRNMLRPVPIPRTQPYRCRGGPYSRQVLFLQSPGTLQVSVGKRWRGRYEAGGKPDELVWRDDERQAGSLSKFVPKLGW